MTGRDIFKIWAPAGVKWADWVRPVPFVAINEETKGYKIFDNTIPSLDYISNLSNDTAIIVDMPGYDSVKDGLALAKLGFRPIPIYNGTNEQDGAIATVDNHTIEVALMWGAVELERIELANDAPPAFLLDTNRMHRYKMNISVFDNSWDIYDQDIPSAEYFLKNNITKIIIRGESIQKDLNKILYKFQKKGIEIFFTNGYEVPKKVPIKKPRRKDI